jgi:chaperonin cofactor prefoldin
MVEVQKQPFTVHDLKITGDEVMEILNLEPSPEIGKILNKLFKEVVDKGLSNKKEELKKRVEELK